MVRQSKILKPAHAEPSDFWLDYILLPYGQYYKPTLGFKDAKKGDILRFHNGKDYYIERVFLIQQDHMCDILSRMRYGIPWKEAFRRWQSNAVLEGNDRNVLSQDLCFWVVYGSVCD